VLPDGEEKSAINLNSLRFFFQYPVPLVNFSVSSLATPSAREPAMSESKEILEIRSSVRQLCQKYGEDYWLELDRTRGYPTEFVKELTTSGFLTVLIPEEYGGAGLGVIEASAVMEEVCRSGAHAGACHAQMYVMGSVLRHGSEEQKKTYLPKIASGELRLQSFGVTEPTTGTDTTSLKTFAERDGDSYVINGQKVWISRIEHTDLMVLLARTTPKEEVARKTEGLSAFIVDVKAAMANGLTISPIEAMINHHACELFFDNLRIPADNLLGEEGRGFRVILDGMNAERILIGAECVGDGKYFIDKASTYATERVVFDRPIGQNQGIQFPIARCYAEVEAASLMVEKAAQMFDAGEPCGAEANMAKMLASEASWHAGDVCMQTHGGFAFAKEYHIERKFRETRLYQIAPISTNLILSYIGEHVLKMPRSF
jgi:acyl-CoA dehydrogenase